MIESPEQIYEYALKERESPDPLKKIDACEKGWLAITRAVDSWLAMHNRFVSVGTAKAHGERQKFLAELSPVFEEAERLADLVSIGADQLHGACFYLGNDAPKYDKTLKETVREVLELTGARESKLEM